MEEKLIELIGKITYILFQNETNFYTVAKFQINDEKERVITITGILPNVEEDVLYHIAGYYTEHPRYGMQFNVKTFEKPLPSEEEGVVRYLSSAQFEGIGKKTAQKVVEALGENCLADIRDNPDILYQVHDLTQKQIDAIKDGMSRDDDSLQELVRFLNVHGIGIRNLVRLNKAYGKDALSKVKENPYRVIEECDGFGFKTADQIAMSLGFAKDDPRRVYAYLVSLTMDLCMRDGNSFVRLEVLEEAFRKKTYGIDADFEELLNEAVSRKSLVREDNRIYPVSQYEAESFTASFLKDFPYKRIDPFDMDVMHRYLEDMQKDINITYDARQVEAIETFFQVPFLIMTGGPGTGKTTVVRAMTTLFRLMYPNATVVCAAPTGRAAKRLAEITETGTATIHSLLQWDLESNTFGKNEEDPINADLLIVDEFSMVDSYLFSNLLKASKNVRKICVIGDEDQLPSVGPGSVLRDLISSEMFRLVRLNHIYRQKNGSDVIALAHEIREGTVEDSALTGDVAFLECQPSSVKNTVVTVVENALEKGYSIDDIQVLSPMYNGPAGIDVLNNALQESFNPKSVRKNEVRMGYTTFREGDKILQLKNQPDDEVYNGDIGILQEIVPSSESEDHKTTIVVNFQGIFVEYKPENWINITLAYCISVHKSQGSEYPIVIMPFARSHAIMLQRKLIYTGVTRARKALVMLGEKSAFRMGVETLERHPRETTLSAKLKQAFDQNDLIPEDEKQEELDPLEMKPVRKKRHNPFDEDDDPLANM